MSRIKSRIGDKNPRYYRESRIISRIRDIRPGSLLVTHVRVEYAHEDVFDAVCELFSTLLAGK